MPLMENVKLTKVADYTTAATTAVNGTHVDMAGYEGVVFFASFGTAATNNTINAAQGATTSSFDDLEGTSVTSGASDEDVWIDIYKPTGRYVRPEIARGTSSTVETIWAMQYGPRKAPVDNNTTGTIAGEVHATPAEGTA